MENKAMNQDQQIEQMEAEVIRLETLVNKYQSIIDHSLLDASINPGVMN